MPANKKHLTPAFHHRFAKITAGFIGGFLITSLLFLLLALLTDHIIVLMTMKFAGFIVWCALLVIPFLFKSGWKAWGLYLLIMLLLSTLFYFTKSQAPELIAIL